MVTLQNNCTCLSVLIINVSLVKFIAKFPLILSLLDDVTKFQFLQTEGQGNNTTNIANTN